MKVCTYNSVCGCAVAVAQCAPCFSKQRNHPCLLVRVGVGAVSKGRDRGEKGCVCVGGGGSNISTSKVSQELSQEEKVFIR